MRNIVCVFMLLCLPCTFVLAADDLIVVEDDPKLSGVVYNLNVSQRLLLSGQDYLLYGGVVSETSLNYYQYAMTYFSVSDGFRTYHYDSSSRTIVLEGYVIEVVRVNKAFIEVSIVEYDDDCRYSEIIYAPPGKTPNPRHRAIFINQGGSD